jgi:hypothetical protein
MKRGRTVRKDVPETSYLLCTTTQQCFGGPCSERTSLWVSAIWPGPVVSAPLLRVTATSRRSSRTATLRAGEVPAKAGTALTYVWNTLRGSEREQKRLHTADLTCSHPSSQLCDCRFPTKGGVSSFLEIDSIEFQAHNLLGS